ncbi:MAG TPA: HdeD family acid-resistance protein [Candidatus Binatia bacterium]|nr:HdeD family acid-resistance protein [Candidatus Binatia bacterium]
MNTIERTYDNRPVEALDVDILARNWWAVLLRGVAGILFGIATFFAPAISLAVLVLLFGAYALVDGVLALISALRNRATNEQWWVLLLEGFVGIIAGIVTFVWPGITAVALLYVIAAWALVTGALEITAAIRLRKVIDHEWLLVLSGVASIALGILLALFPGAGALALALWIGAYAILFGVLLVALGFRLRSWERSGSLHPVHHPA